MLEGKLLMIRLEDPLLMSKVIASLAHLQTFVSSWGDVRPLRAGKSLGQYFMSQSAAVLYLY